MHTGTLIEKFENGVTTYFIANEKGEVEISKNQQDSDEIFLFIGNIVNYNISFKPRKAEIGDKVTISSIPLSEFSNFMDEVAIKKKLEGVIISEIRNIYTIETKSGIALLKRDCFCLVNKTNDIKIAVVQDIIEKQNAKANRKGSNKSSYTKNSSKKDYSTKKKQ